MSWKGFTTSELGTDLGDTNLVGRTWELDLGNGTLTEPASLGSLLDGYLDHSVWIGATGQDPKAETLSLIGTVPSDGGSR